MAVSIASASLVEERPTVELYAGWDGDFDVNNTARDGSRFPRRISGDMSRESQYPDRLNSLQYERERQILRKIME